MSAEDASEKIPKSMVIKMGDSKRQVGPSLSQLVKDFRAVMQPHTAAKLRERRSNKLKDFLVMCGPLGVSHLVVFSQSQAGNATMRVARTPHGPTLNFRVSSYSLIKDIRRLYRNPKSPSQEHTHPPLLVMNGFQSKSQSQWESALTSMFQTMFPPINIQTVRVSAIKRVLLLNRDKSTGRIDLRHYLIETKTVEASRAVRKLGQAQSQMSKSLPNLSSKEDISQYLLDPYTGQTSDSEGEGNAVTVQVSRQLSMQQKSDGSETSGKEKRAVKMIEIGPRLTLELRKIEEGVCGGRTLMHALYTKSEREAARVQERHADRARLREKRKQEQRENVQNKKSKLSRSQRGKQKVSGDHEADDRGDDDSDGH